MNLAEAKLFASQLPAAVAAVEQADRLVADAKATLKNLEQQITDTSLRLQPIEDDCRKKKIEAAEAVRDRDRAREELGELNTQIASAQRELARINSIREQAAARLTDPLNA